MRKIVGIKNTVFLGFLVFGFPTFGQIITQGKILFERKTNLDKKFQDERMKSWLGNTKSKIDNFELIFNDTISIFKPVESDVADKMSWTTSKSTVVQNFAQNEKLILFDIAGQQVFMKDTNEIRKWKITDSKRTIGKYKCQKAIYEKNDTTRIYAWYSVDVVPSVGPEGFFGLPGAILGLATEDGGIIYFAKEIEFVQPKNTDFEIDTKKKTVYTSDELRTKLEKDFANSPWGKRMFDDLFRWL